MKSTASAYPRAHHTLHVHFPDVAMAAPVVSAVVADHVLHLLEGSIRTMTNSIQTDQREVIHMDSILPEPISQESVDLPDPWAAALALDTLPAYRI
jgi:hypothetical protein